TSYFGELVDAGYLRRDGEQLRLTELGTRQAELIALAWRDWLMEQLHDWLPARSEEDQAMQVKAALGRITRRVMLEEERARVGT
ncbi:MAG: MFS transporter, partial [Actinobacteria bacterium]|nr:MFS transporter [Actinomycetota bacterium]